MFRRVCARQRDRHDIDDLERPIGLLLRALAYCTDRKDVLLRNGARRQWMDVQCAVMGVHKSEGALSTA